MGEMIYCRCPIAATPYYIDEVSLNIYSLEELSYYIQHNVYLLNQDFMSTELCNWIGRELGLKTLMNELLEMLQQGKPLHVFVGRLLTETGYLTNAEIRNLLDVISSFENKSETECRKMRADRLMEKEKYVDAIYEYHNVLDEIKRKSVAPMLQGDIWHNLATAYARLFFFQEAIFCYEKAYLLNHREPSLAGLLYAYKCMRDGNGFEGALRKYNVSCEKSDALLKHLEEVTKSEEIRNFDEALVNEYDEEKLRHILSKWKKEYTTVCRS